MASTLDGAREAGRQEEKEAARFGEKMEGDQRTGGAECASYK